MFYPTYERLSVGKIVCGLNDRYGKLVNRPWMNDVIQQKILMSIPEDAGAVTLVFETYGSEKKFEINLNV